MECNQTYDQSIKARIIYVVVSFGKSVYNDVSPQGVTDMKKAKSDLAIEHALKCVHGSPQKSIYTTQPSLNAVRFGLTMAQSFINVSSRSFSKRKTGKGYHR